MSVSTQTTDPAKKITVYRGELRIIAFEVSKTTEGVTSPLDLTGKRVFAYVKRNAAPATAVEFSSVTPTGISVTDAVNGKFSWIISSANSDRLALPYLYAIGCDDGSGGDRTTLEGGAELLIEDIPIEWPA